MNSQLTFQSDALENAEVMLDMCRTEFERAGHSTAAQTLRGLDVKSLSSAHAALITLHALPRCPSLDDMVQCAISSVKAAFYVLREMQKPLLMAS